MKKLFLIGLGVLFITCSVNAQNKLERGRTLREIHEFYQFTVGKDNKLQSFTDRKDYYINDTFDWMSEYQTEISTRLNDTTIVTEGVKMSYTDSLFHKFYDLLNSEEKLEVCINGGNKYVFRYINSKRFKGCTSKKEKARHLQEEMAKYPGCSIEPLADEDWSDRILVSKSFYDFHHQMWRPNATNDDYLIPQLETDVVVTSGFSKKASSILGILNYYAADRYWDPVRIETDSINYAFVFTLSEGRNAIIVFYMENGKMKEEKVVPRPLAEFSNFSFTAQTTKDVCQMDVNKGVVDIKIYPSINGTGLTKNPKFAIRWQAEFKGPGEDTWERIGKVDL